ncbi:RIP metalloprotease RseP [Opitutus sp. ER46]|uniref:RIP metalloprotease RseP n=1 Tax=Opitutus sp. ER46 TaxID=2161864 RepID=UPI000D308FF9|nr:RIP metalloprotease RseP [Opitutus sp. ER46]PTX90670.1 RIP metalloprotease RseP [Opitutus sp. ER46]
MSSDLLQSIFSNVWVMFLVVLLFGGSIFVHELGHFLAARRRGAHVERFSIGFGPAIWSWHGRDGVEYRISWIPLGGYVLLPQLADLGAIEGESKTSADALPPVNYATKMIVFVAGATFNILFAFALACIVWYIGQPVATGFSSTTVAEIMPTIKTADKQEVVSPAVKAGLKPGDVILAVDGAPVQTFNDIVEHLALSSGWSDGQRQTVFTVRREGRQVDLPIQPVISGNEKVRMVGFTTVAKLVIGRIAPGTPAAQSGLQLDDRIVAIDQKPVLTLTQLVDALRAPGDKPLELSILRGGEARTLSMSRPKDGGEVGIVALKTDFVYTHPSPFAQVGDCVVKTFRTLWALVNPRSDIGISHLSGPIGIISNFVDVSRAGLPFALWFTILVNVNLAILNLLPIPVLDGGQMLFATIARLRGRALPTNFVMATQSVFFVLIFAMIGYISFFVDIPRIVRDSKAERAAEAPAKPAPESAPAPTPAPAPAK